MSSRLSGKQALREAQSACLISGPAARCDHTSGVMAHYTKDWTMHTVVLTCKRFNGRHTAHNIVHEYEEIIQHFGISDKITNIVTDNASNMIAAFAHPGFTSHQTSERNSTEDEEETTWMLQTRCVIHCLQSRIPDLLTPPTCSERWA